MKKSELEQILAIRAEIHSAFDPHAMAYDQARVMNAHRMINRLADAAKAREAKR